MTELERSYKLFVDAGFILIPTKTNTKFASGSGAYKERTTKPFSPRASGYAAIVPPHIISVDIDVAGEKIGEESYARLLKDLNLNYIPEATTLSQSGGRHVFFENLYPDKIIGSELPKLYKHVDIFAGYQTVHPIPKTSYKNDDGEIKTYEWESFDEEIVINPWADSLLDILQLRDRGEKVESNYSEMDTLIKAEDMSDDEVDTLLKTIGYNTDHGDWITIGMALYDRYGGNAEGRKRWVDFCMASPKADSNKSTGADKWDKGQLIPDAVTYKRLRYLAKGETLVPLMRERIEKAETEAEFNAIADDIGKDHNWATLVQNHEETLTEFAELWRKGRQTHKVDSRLMQVSTAKKCFEPEIEEIEAGDIPWLDNIIYVDGAKSTHKYFYLPQGSYYSLDAMESLFVKELKALAKKQKSKSYSLKSLTKGMLTICTHAEYNPLHQEKIITKPSGQLILNTYNPESKPKPAIEYTERGQELVKAFKRHIHMIMSEREAVTFLDMLAWQLQNFGKKLLWSPLIQSTQGVGKTVVGTIIIKHLFGTQNAGVVDPDVLMSENNSWATGGVMRILEEVKVSGHNRHEAMNRLKAIVTNEKISRVEKYEVTTEVKNFTNIIAFTNYKDAIPAENSDRRWWIIYSRIRSLKQIEEETGKTIREYFTPLYELQDKNSPYGAELLKYFLERDTSNFEPSFLPDSVHKERAVAGEDSMVEFLSEMKDMVKLAEPYQGVTSQVASTRQIKLALEHKYDMDVTRLAPKSIALLMKRLDFEKAPFRFKYEGEEHSLWTSLVGVSEEAIKALFKESMEKGLPAGLFNDIRDEETY